MKKLILLFLILPSIIFSQKKPNGMHSLKLISVTENNNKLSVDSLNGLTTEDFVINWYYDRDDVKFNFKNKSDKSYKILWNESVLIDVNGNTKKIFHNSVKIIDRDKDQIPTIIYGKSNLIDAVMPIDNVYYESGRYGGWRSNPILPTRLSGLSGYEKPDDGLLGKTLRIVMPIEVEANRVEYIYEFEVIFKNKEEFLKERKKLKPVFNLSFFL